ncbi:MAG: SRPBCC domain-containing protein [Bacteroidetes bacterium]|nr:SRPBCC domain-containing protein [Bacteroidota bacterium]
MSNGISISRSIVINAPSSTVWHALTDPAIVKQYMFGTDMTAEWRVGGRITYRGEWQGQSYEDGGTILALEPGRYLKATYWSSMSGTENTPENQLIIINELADEAGGTRLTITQENNKTTETAEHSGSNWQMILEAIKKICEAQ